ncbi:MAG: TonB-dependent receptor, partial [Bacteroidota bacterium]
ISPERVRNLDLSYLFRSNSFSARITGYYLGFQNQTDIGFYFTENVSGLGLEKDAFVQEVTTGIDSRSMGVEVGMEVPLGRTLKFKAAGSWGHNTFVNNPDLYLRSDDFEGFLRFGDGTTRIKNYHLSAGPERVVQLGVEYRDPAYWWFGLSTNYFSHAYIDVNHLARSANFTSDFDGQPFNDYSEEEALSLLEQERLDPYVLVNLVGGKSWRVGGTYFGFFASIANLLDQEYTTGGFEQGRLSNFRDRRIDHHRPNGPIFGNRYFFGRGTTYFFNLYVSF